MSLPGQQSPFCDIPSRRAAGETLQSIADDIGVSTTTVFRKQYGARRRPAVEPTERSYVVRKSLVGQCSSDFSTIDVSLARSAA